MTRVQSESCTCPHISEAAAWQSTSPRSARCRASTVLASCRNCVGLHQGGVNEGSGVEAGSGTGERRQKGGGGGPHAQAASIWL